MGHTTSAHGGLSGGDSELSYLYLGLIDVYGEIGDDYLVHELRGNLGNRWCNSGTSASTGRDSVGTNQAGLCTTASSAASVFAGGDDLGRSGRLRDVVRLF